MSQSTAEVFPLGPTNVLLSGSAACRTLSLLFLERGADRLWEGIDTLPQNLREIRPTALAVVPRVLEKMQGKIMDGVRQLPGLKQRLFIGPWPPASSGFPFSSKGEPRRWD